MKIVTALIALSLAAGCATARVAQWDNQPAGYQVAAVQHGPISGEPLVPESTEPPPPMPIVR